MNLNLRRLIFYFFCLAFVVITPIIILYASGYQIDWNHLFTPLAVQKTGMTIIYSEPAGASIYLNGREQENISGLILKKILLGKNDPIRTPTRIKDLLPGAYDLRIELPGYWSWERRVEIYPGKITHVLDVNLFRKDQPLLLAELPEQNIALAPNNKKIFLPATGELFDLKTELLEKTSLPGQAASSTVSWSADSNRLVVGKNLLNLKNISKDLDLEKIIGADITNLRWNGETDKIYYQYKDAIDSFNLNSQKDELIIKESKVLDFEVRGKELYYVVESGLSAKLKFYSLSDKKIDKEISLPSSDGYKLINQGSKLINLYDEKYKTLYLVDPAPNAADPLIETINAVEKTEWVNDQELVWANNFEIWALDLTKNEKKLIIRWSEPIKSIMKTKTENYIIFSTEKTINVISWAANDEIQTTELTAMEKILPPVLVDKAAPPVFPEGEKDLYFIGVSNGKEGLYKLNIQ